MIGKTEITRAITTGYEVDWNNEEILHKEKKQRNRDDINLNTHSTVL